MPSSLRVWYLKLGATYKDPVINMSVMPIFCRFWIFNGFISQIGSSNITTSVPTLNAAKAMKLALMLMHVPGTEKSQYRFIGVHTKRVARAPKVQ